MKTSTVSQKRVNGIHFQLSRPILIFMTKTIKNILRGAGSVVELFPSHGKIRPLYNPAASTEDALRKDWEKVGDDIGRATEKYGKTA